jgi:hypothetical protein
MIKLLSVAAFLFISGISLIGASGGFADPLRLSISVVAPPWATRCAVGPDANIPAPAAKAGFTNCLFAADFTVPGGFWATKSNWLINCNASASQPNQPSTWHMAYVNGLAAQNGWLPCSQVNIVTDTGGGGTQALNETFLNSQQCTGNQCVGSMEYPAVYGGPAGNSNWLATEYYSKLTVRYDCQTVTQTTDCSINDGSNLGELGMFSTAEGNPDWIDEDGPESDWGIDGVPSGQMGTCLSSTDPSSSGSEDTAICTNTAAYPIIPKTPQDYTNYHTFEVLFTSNEVDALANCAWIDGVFVDCKARAVSDSMTVEMLTAHGRINDQFIGIVGGGTPPWNYDQQAWVTHWEMWTCSNVATSGCPGTLVTTWPWGFFEMPKFTPSGKPTVLGDFEGKLKARYGENKHAIYGTLNKIGLMHGNKATVKGKRAAKNPLRAS